MVLEAQGLLQQFRFSQGLGVAVQGRSAIQTGPAIPTKRRGGIAPAASRRLKLAGPGAESALFAKPLGRLSGRSQRGDSAWCKTLNHLLSLLVETLV
jgi:hypothetical protein